MRRYGKNGDLALVRAVVPEYRVSRRGVLFGVSFKDFLAFWPLQAEVFVGLEAVMPRIRRQQFEGFSDCLVTFLFGKIVPE